MEKKRVLITAGGTGGHIFPALALAKQLSTDARIEVIFSGGNLSSNRYFDSNEYRCYSTSCGSFTNKNPFKLMKAFGKIGQGIWQSHRFIDELRPDLAVGFGSYYTFPTLMAALLHKIPVVLHEANSIPGKVNRLLSRYARVTGIHFPETAVQMRGKTVLVGMPLRPGFQKGTVSVEAARAYFQLSTDQLTLLVFGGSQGAQTLNMAVLDALCSPVGQCLQVIHLTGNPEATYRAQNRYREWNIPACVKEFETRMDLAWQAADLTIARSGAGTISEAIEFEVPGLLIPYPYAADNHQEKNADFMVETVGGAEKIREIELNSPLLMQKLEALLAKRLTMRSRIAQYKKEARQKNLGDLVMEILF